VTISKFATQLYSQQAAICFGGVGSASCIFHLSMRERALNIPSWSQ